MNERSDKQNVLEINALSVSFTEKKEENLVVDSASLCVKRGEIVVLLGESGSGKSVTASCVLDLLAEGGSIRSGDIVVCGKNVRGLSKRELINLRGNEVGMIFQNAQDALNPLFTVETLVTEAIRAHKRISKKAARAEAVELLGRMRLSEPKKLMHEYPFELSGGMCQRVMIAIAMSMHPSLLIADEPTTALDVTVQAGILCEIEEMAKKSDTGVLFITHDLGIAAEIADYIYVMQNGKIVDMGDAEAIFNRPQHDYTKQLIASII